MGGGVPGMGGGGMGDMDLSQMLSGLGGLGGGELLALFICELLSVFIRCVAVFFLGLKFEGGWHAWNGRRRHGRHGPQPDAGWVSCHCCMSCVVLVHEL